jgi:hypothetical protein
VSCPYIFYCSQTHHFLSFLEKRVRLGVSYYLTITLPETKAKAKIEEYSAVFKIDRSASIRSRNKKMIPPVDLLVLQNRNLQKVNLVTLIFLFHLDDHFFVTFPEAHRISKIGSQVLNDIFGLKRKENFVSIFDKKQKIAVQSYSNGALVPVYSIEKLEIPSRLRGTYENYSSHQWVVRLHRDFVRGKVEKIDKLFEKVRNLPKTEKIEQQEGLYQRIERELAFLEKFYPSFGVQKDVEFIKKRVFEKNKKAHPSFMFNFTHPTFKSIKPYSHDCFETLIKIEK